MAAYYIEVPDLEPQTLIHYNEIFKEILKGVYNIVPKVDWIDNNKYSLDRLIEVLPEYYERGNTIHYNAGLDCVCYGYSLKYLIDHHVSLIQVAPVCSDRIFIGVL